MAVSAVTTRIAARGGSHTAVLACRVDGGADARARSSDARCCRPVSCPFAPAAFGQFSYSRPIPIRYERSRRRPGWPTKARLSGEWSWSSPLGVDAGHGIYSASFERPRATSTAARRVKSSSWFRIGHPETPISEPLCTGPSHDAGRAVVSSPMVVRRASLADGKVGKVGPEVAERRVGPVW